MSEQATSDAAWRFVGSGRAGVACAGPAMQDWPSSRPSTSAARRA